MDPVTWTIVGWLVEPAASALFDGAKEILLQRLGLGSSPPESPPLLNEYLDGLQHVRQDIRRLRDRIDEDRIAKLLGAFAQLKDASKSNNTTSGFLHQALMNFQEIAQIPQEEQTGERTNAELRSMAFIGMAASYCLLHSENKLIAEKMVEAVEADNAVAKQWLGESLVSQIMWVPCPRCGHWNPPGSCFCNQDGYLLIPDLHASTPADEGSNKDPIRELLAEPQFSKFSPVLTYPIKELTQALAMNVKRVQLARQFPHDFTKVALALFTAIDPYIEDGVAVYDIPNGFMLKAMVYPEYEWGGLSHKSHQAACLFCFVEKKERLLFEPQVMVLMMFLGGQFGIGKKYLDWIEYQMLEQLNIDRT